jgi:C1A family cysteine protease
MEVPKLGCIPDRPDPRDYNLTRATAPVALPRSIDYTPEMSPVGNQFTEGICVGFATVDGLKEYQEEQFSEKYVDLSVRYVYEYARQYGDIPSDEEGAMIRDAMKVLLDKGVCPEDCWRFIPGIKGTPCDEADDLAEPFQIERYVRINTIEEMKESLVQNGPFVAGIDVYKGMFDAPAGVVPMPGPNENPEGGHAVCIVGYDDGSEPKPSWWQAIVQFFRRLFGLKDTTPQRPPGFKFKNSWGRLWGDGGYGYLTYEYMDEFCFDAWSARDKLYRGN